MHTLPTEDELLTLKNRPVSHTTHITCALCGESYKITNRHKVSWIAVDLGNSLCRIHIVCPVNGCEYDIATCDCENS